MPRGRVEHPQPPCGKRCKTCRSCGYRFKAGDQRIKCPECDESRLCKNLREIGLKTCRKHGGRGGRRPSPKFILGGQLSKRVNRIARHPELIAVSEQIAANQARMEELLNMTENFDSSGLSQQFDRGLDIVRRAISGGTRADVIAGLSILEEARAAERANMGIWYEFREHAKLDNALIATSHKIRMDERLVIHPEELLEVMTTFQRVFFRVIKDPKDRQWAIREIREHVGSLQDEIETDGEDEI